MVCRQTMAEHEELVAEMLILEQMGTQERQKLAKKRRLQQLKKWSNREKEWIAKEKQLNKRLASILNEENNGLNLKQYTTYNSNQRNKKRLSTNGTCFDEPFINSNGTSKTSPPTDTINQHNDNNSGQIIEKRPISNSINNNNLATIDGPYANNLAPNGRVHFNVGVMLLEAAARNDYDEVKRLLSLGVSADSVNHDGLTALHQCCIDASESIMNLLLEYGADVDARDTERWTPLHAACTCGHLNLVKILVEHGADLLAVNGDGNMPFDICEDEATLDYIESQMIKQGITQEMIDLTRASGELQMLSSLEEMASTTKDVDLNFVSDNGVSQLHIAATNNYISVVKFLLKNCSNVNVCDNDQWTPLHGVACWGNEQHIKVAEMLVEAGADLSAKTSNDETVFDLCDNATLLERLNQLKDELESKQAVEPDKLRRTQSRTNSRVHSVRRTRVKDKNQISRRDAREEAMLRVESSENANGSSVEVKKDLLSSSPMEIRVDSGVGTVPNSPTIDMTHKNDTLIPIETNLDQTPSIALDETYSIERLSSSSNFVKPSNIDGNRSQTSVEPSSNEHFMTVTQSIPSDDTTEKTSLTSTRQNCDLEERGPPHMSSTQRGTTVVQVHLAPVNYTLSNLKKHRSDLRLRGITSTVQLDPEPGQDDIADRSGEIVTDTVQANGRSASLNKFHGQPSEVIVGHRHDHKCCVII